MNRIRKLFMIYMLLLTVLIVGCSKVPKEKDIKVDIEKFKKVKVVDGDESVMEVRIKNRETKKKEKYDKVLCTVITKKDNVSYEKDVELIYHKYDKGWELEEVTVNDSEEWIIKPLKGVQKEEIEYSLMGQNVKVDDEEWNLVSDEKIKLSIKEQTTNLKKKTDKVSVEVMVEGEMQKIKGTVEVKYKFKEEEWVLTSFKDKGDFKSEFLKGKELNVKEEDLIEKVVGDTIILAKPDTEYYFTNDYSIQECKVSKDNIKDFKIKEHTSSFKGQNQSYKCECRFVKGIIEYSYSVLIDYNYNDGEWGCELLEKDAKFSKLDLLGVWKGTYAGISDTGIVTLKITSFKDNKVTATYAYKPDNKKYNAGSYTVDGTFESIELYFELKAGKWVNKPADPRAYEKADIELNYRINEGVLEGDGHKGYSIRLKKQ